MSTSSGRRRLRWRRQTAGWWRTSPADRNRRSTESSCSSPRLQTSDNTDSITAFTGGLVGIQWQMLNIKSLSSSEENSVSASSSSNWCYSSVFLLQAHLFPDTSGHCGFQQTLLKQERTVNLSGTFISVGWTHVLCSIEAKTMLNLVKISSRGCFYGEEDTTVQLTDAFLIVLGQERTQRKKKKTEYHQI